MMLYRNDYYDKKPDAGHVSNPQTYAERAEAQVDNMKSSNNDSGNSSVVNLTIRKSRDGQLGDVTLLFEKAYMRYSEFSLESQEMLDRI